MTLQEAKEILKSATRHELRDHAFGDAEVTWEKDGHEIASGYFSGTQNGVNVSDPASPLDFTSFTGASARELRDCGKLSSVERNDITGPDEYKEGETMPGLTFEGVRKEICGE